MSKQFFPHSIPISKRLLDLSIALISLIILSPLMILIGILVAVFLGRPIFFRQKRPGFHGKIFKIYKFRTMNEKTDESNQLLPDKDRLTKFGQFLRTTSLDELPELFNILLGDMSIVGPRPLLISYLPLYNPHQMRRHDVLPGLTGWAQVNGRNALTWEEKFDLDVWYVDHWSFGLDLKIMMLTMIKVIKREGISQPGQATSDPFKGTPNKTD
jgi:lipopolysaccharide/colanic/teichoic acid biosynthesis glycosyltransferase